MSNSADDALEREKKQIDASVFVGEEGEDISSPAMNFGAAIFLGLFGLLAMYLAWDLEIPDSIYTAPGLLPMLTGITLVGMAMGLARHAYNKRAAPIGDGETDQKPPFFADPENRRGTLLIVIIAVYIAAIDVLGFDHRFELASLTFKFGSYELFSIAALTLILKLFWQARFLHCALVSVGWIMFLATVFRYGFRVLLPGSG